MTNLNDLEQRVILAALDCYMRVHLGQVPAALDPLRCHLSVSNTDVRGAFHGECQAEDLATRDIGYKAEELQEFITGSRYGGPGIHHPGVSNLARLALRLKHQLQIEWDKRLPSTSDITLDMIDREGKNT